MSVPYALHAKTADNIVGGITETDPTFTASEAANITATDITNLSNLSGTNTGDQTLALTVSQTGDTLTINGGNSVIVPGISLANNPLPAIGDFRDGGVVFWLDGS